MKQRYPFILFIYNKHDIKIYKEMLVSKYIKNICREREKGHFCNKITYIEVKEYIICRDTVLLLSKVCKVYKALS